MTKSQEFLRVFKECPRTTPTTPRGGSCRGLQKHMYGGMSPSGGEKPLLVPLELAGKPLTRITNRKLDWGSRSEHKRASLDTEMSRPQLACPGPGPNPLLMELKLVTKITWKHELGFSSGLVTG